MQDWIAPAGSSCPTLDFFMNARRTAIAGIATIASLPNARANERTVAMRAGAILTGAVPPFRACTAPR